MNRRTGRWLWLAAAVIALAGLAFCLWHIFSSRLFPLPDPPYPGEGEEDALCPVDFTDMQRRNPDIYAWLQVPGADVNHPVAQHPGEDEYYLHSDLYGNYSDGGSLFTQATYNGLDLEDPVTIIYGHEMEDGSMFGSLQPWAARLDLEEEAAEFFIYQPGRRLTYRVFAAVPWTDDHILYKYDFREEWNYESFFEEVLSVRSLDARLAPEQAPEYGERVVILETCLAGDDSKRYLVMGVLEEDAREDPNSQAEGGS